jgi:hypothetical protein
MAPEDVPLPPGAEPVPSPAPVAAPTAFDGDASAGPSVGIAKYNPRTGEYMGSDGNMYRQSDLVTTPKSWQDMMPT